MFGGISAGELKAARSLGASAGLVEHRFVRLPDLLEAQDRGLSFPGLPPTYIPLRNAVFYSLAASYAEEVGADLLVGGHNRDDLSVFRDAGSGFFSRMEEAIRSASAALDGRGFRILRPLEGLTKPQVLARASRLGVPLELTWSCHSGGRRSCWRCPGCLSRRAAFRSAGLADPLDRSWPRKVS